MPGLMGALTVMAILGLMMLLARGILVSMKLLLWFILIVVVLTLVTEVWAPILF